MNGVESAQLRQSVAVTLEPGDGTHYEFVVTRDRYQPRWLAVTNVGLVDFQGYDFNVDEVVTFWKTHGPTPVYAEYRAWCEKVAESGDAFLGYVSEHMTRNLWSAIAAIIAMVAALEEWRLL